MGTFRQGARDLAKRIGRGKLEGKVIVDQIYAASQHEGHWVTGPLAGHVIRHHPQGGQAKYIEAPLFDHAEHYFQRLADNVIEGSLEDAMAENVAHLSDQVFEKAPREFDDLRLSAHAIVTSNGHVVFDNPPTRKRLTREELKAKSRRRR